MFFYNQKNHIVGSFLTEKTDFSKLNKILLAIALNTKVIGS